MWKGCIRRWKIAVGDVGQSFCLKGLRLALENRNFTQVLFRAKTVVPDVSKWRKSQFYTYFWMFASDVNKSQFSHSYCCVTFMPRLHLNCQNHNFTRFWRLTLSSCVEAARGRTKLHFTTCLDVRPARSLQRVARAQKKFTFHHMLGRSKHTTCLPIRHARSPQRVAQGQTRPAFRHTGCPTRCRG